MALVSPGALPGNYTQTASGPAASENGSAAGASTWPILTSRASRGPAVGPQGRRRAPRRYHIYYMFKSGWWGPPRAPRPCWLWQLSSANLISSAYKGSLAVTESHCECAEIYVWRILGKCLGVPYSSMSGSWTKLSQISLKLKLISQVEAI